MSFPDIRHVVYCLVHFMGSQLQSKSLSEKRLVTPMTQLPGIMSVHLIGLCISSLCALDCKMFCQVAAMSSPEEVKALYRRLGVASSVHAPDDRDTCCKLVEVLKSAQRSSAEDFVQAEPEACLLCSYSADPASTLVSTTTRTQSSKAPRLTRKGKLLHELLMQRLVLMRDVGGTGRQMQHLFAEPRLLSEGKGQWHIFVAATELFPLPRKLGHKGPLLQHVVADRAQLTAVARLLRCRQELFYSEEHGRCEDQRALELELTDFFFFNGCVLHDTQNALQWSVQGLASGDSLQHCHIIMESLRNSSVPLLATIPALVSHSLAFREQPAANDLVLSEFWSLLGVEATLMESVVTIDPWFSNGALLVNASVQHMADPVQAVVHSITALCRWRAFTESRFLSMSTAAAGLLGSLAVGLKQLVLQAKESPLTSSYHLNGFQRLSPEVTLLMVVLTLVGSLVNSIHTLMMDDHRLALHLDSFRLVLREELDAAHSRPPLVWERLATLVSSDQDWQALRSQCLNSLHIAAAYIEEKALGPFSDYPWKFATGSAVSRLEELESLPEAPAEVNAQKLWKLLQAGYPKAKLAAVLGLLKQAPFSTMPVEQAHGSSATVKKFHPTLEINQHLQRAYLHQCRHLFAESEDAKREAAMDKALVQANAPARPLSARHLFLKDMVAAAKQRSPQRCLSQHTMRQIMKTHGDLFQNLSLTDLKSYEIEAARLCREQDLARQDDLEHLFAQCRLWQQRKRAEERGDAVFDPTIVKARLTSEEMLSLYKRFQSGEWSQATLKQRRQEALLPPSAPRVEVQQIFSNQTASWHHASRPDPPLWVKVFCEHRESLQGAIITADPADESLPAFRFLYASQNPRQAVFQRLQRVDVPVPLYRPEHGDDLAEMATAWQPWNFSVVLGSYCLHQDLPLEVPDQLWVLEHARFTEDLALSGIGWWQCVDHLIEHYPHRHRHREPSSKPAVPRTSAHPADADLEAHPWLAEYLSSSSAGMSSKQSSSRAQGSRPSTPSQPVGTLSEDALQEVWDELAVKRATWSESRGLIDRDFVVEVRGGKWTAEHKKVTVDAITASARTEVARRWASTYQENRMASFSTLKYGERVAGLLATEWSRRRQHYLDIWLLHDGGSHVYTEAEKLSYEPSPEWEQFIRSLRADQPESDRAMAIHTFFPSLPAKVSASSGTQ